MAEPPAGSGLKPVMGDSGLPIIGHLIEFFRGGPDYALEVYRKYGPIHYQHSPALCSVMALGPDATQAVFSNRNKEFSQRAWDPVIGPFFDRGLMLLDFDEHMFHRRIMQEAFTRSRLSGYVEHIDSVATQVLANDWVANDRRFQFYPAAKELTLDIASVVFMGHEPGTDHELVTTINQAFTTTTRAGNAIVRKPVRPLTWWRGIEARKTLENYFSARVAETRRLRGHRHAQRAVPGRGRGRPAVHRRRHRLPHDLPDDGRPRHVDLDVDDDGLPPGGQPRVAGTVPRRVGPASATGRWTSRRSTSWKPTTW